MNTPEAAAVARVIRDYKPDLLGDFHEYQERGASKVLFSNPDRLHLNVSPRIQTLSAELNRYADSAVKAGDFESGLYPSSNPEADEGVMRQQAALRHSGSLLVETPRLGSAIPGGARLRNERPLARCCGWRVKSRRTCEPPRRQPPRLPPRKAPRGKTVTTTCRPGSTAMRLRARTCFLMTSTATCREVLDLHGVQATSSDGSWTIPTSQAEQPMVGLLLDERAPHELVSGEPFPVDIAATVGTPARLPYGSDIKLATTPFR